MKRTTILLICASLSLSACAADSGSPMEVMPLEAGAEFVGGWDGAQTEGTSVLLLRDGLTGTLSAARLIGQEEEFEISYEVEGSMSDDEGSLVLALSCAEARTRPLGAELEPTDPLDPMASGDTDAAAPSWSSLDCAGWELDLECGLAGDCQVGDCNMVCDVVYFGDAYATASVPLSTIEDEFDYWRRV